ncbi:hypothetical protein D3C71_1627010 [compost metagenome]
MLLGGQVLVQHALPVPADACGNQAVALVFPAVHVAGQGVAVGRERGPGKFGRHTQLLVGINEEQVAAIRACQLQCFVAVVRKVLPGALEQGTGNVVHELADDVLRAIGGARVHDDPVVYPGLDRSEAPGDNRGLVLDDHVEHDGGHVSHRSSAWALEAGNPDPGRLRAGRC